MSAGAATKLPKWLAPNLITLTGTMALVAAYFVSMYYTPDFEGEQQLLADWERICPRRLH